MRYPETAGGIVRGSRTVIVGATVKIGPCLVSLRSHPRVKHARKKVRPASPDRDKQKRPSGATHTST